MRLNLNPWLYFACAGLTVTSIACPGSDPHPLQPSTPQALLPIERTIALTAARDNTKTIAIGTMIAAETAAGEEPPSMMEQMTLGAEIDEAFADFIEACDVELEETTRVV